MRAMATFVEVPPMLQRLCSGETMPSQVTRRGSLVSCCRCVLALHKELMESTSVLLNTSKVLHMHARCAWNWCGTRRLAQTQDRWS